MSGAMDFDPLFGNNGATYMDNTAQRPMMRSFSNPGLRDEIPQFGGPPIRNMQPYADDSRRFEEQRFSGHFDPEFDDFSQQNKEEMYAEVNRPVRETTERQSRPAARGEQIPRSKFRYPDSEGPSKPMRFDVGPRKTQERFQKRMSPPLPRQLPTWNGYRRRSYSYESSGSEEYNMRRGGRYPGRISPPPIHGPVPDGPGYFSTVPMYAPPRKDAYADGPPARFVNGPPPRNNTHPPRFFRDDDIPPPRFLKDENRPPPRRFLNDNPNDALDGYRRRPAGRQTWEANYMNGHAPPRGFY